MEKEKKKNKLVPFILIAIILVILILAYCFINYSKLPTDKDYSGSEYAGTWLMCGEGFYPSMGEPLDVSKMTEFDGSIVNNASFFEADKVEEIIASDEGQILDGNGFYFLPEKRVLYENGRATLDCLNSHEKATWEETDNGIHWKPFMLDSPTNQEAQLFSVEEIKGFTPEKLGFSGDKFLVLMDNPPEDLQIEDNPNDVEIPEGAEIEYRTGFMVFAKK